jgi:small subunit ribosomal protein S23
MWLMENEGLERDEAYDRARREFYHARLREDVERRIAKEEAEAYGAYWGMSMSEVGMELEDREYERWKAWAENEIAELELRRASAYTGLPDVVEHAEDAAAGGTTPKQAG